MDAKDVTDYLPKLVADAKYPYVGEAVGGPLHGQIIRSYGWHYQVPVLDEISSDAFANVLKYNGALPGVMNVVTYTYKRGFFVAENWEGDIPDIEDIADDEA